MRKKAQKTYDFIVVGGGMSGICAALAAARNGAKTALIQERPVLGGNASSEIRMHICGADRHGAVANARETGIIEELLLKNRAVNSQHSFSVQDTVFWDSVVQQENLDLFLNTRITSLEVENGKILAASGYQSTTEKEFVFTADYFADATGDGFLGYTAGAEYMSGTEGRNVFNEPHAPEKSSKNVMGSSLLFTARDVGRPVKFVKPEFAYTFTENDLKRRKHKEISSGYWWIELGGDTLDTISDNEEIRDELLKTLYGVWDHIKNAPGHDAANYALDWVGFLPGKRESRRLTGDYILTENDIIKNTYFDDAVAYGGWGIDIHTDGGLRGKSDVPHTIDDTNGIYQIPYRCLYSKNINNLFLAGRAISVSHLAFGSTRVMGTCAVVGHAVGTAAAMCVNHKLLPRELLSEITQLQQRLLLEDAYIPGVKNTDEKDLCKTAEISASSYIIGGEPQNVANGIARETDSPNAYISDGLSKGGEWLLFDFNRFLSVKTLIVKFDSNLSKELTITLSDEIRRNQHDFPSELVKNFNVELIKDGDTVKQISVKDNIQRLVKLNFDETVCDKIKINFSETHGAGLIRVFEVRIY